MRIPIRTTQAPDATDAASGRPARPGRARAARRPACASASAGSERSRSSATRARSARLARPASSRGAPDVDVSLHVEPFPAELAAQRLQKQRARFESTRRLERERGSLADLGVAAAAEDADELAKPARPRREPPLPRRPLPLRHAPTAETSSTTPAERVRSALRLAAPRCTPATFRPLDGWLSTLPLGLDRLRLRRTFDSEALAASFPFAAADPPLEDEGCFYGLSDIRRPDRLRPLRARQLQQRHPRPLRRRQELPGQARSAAPALPRRAGVHHRPRRRIPPPLPGGRRRLPPARRRGRRSRSTRSTSPPAQKHGGARRADRLPHRADRAARRRPHRRRAGRARPRRPRLLRSRRDQRRPRHPPAPGAAAPRPRRRTRTAGRRGATRLAERLSPYTTGSLSSALHAPTSVHPEGQLVCFSLRGLPERLKPVALLLCLDAIWRSLDEPPAQPLRARRRGLAADARTGRGELPLPAREERAQTLVRPDHDHPGRRRPARLRTRAVDRHQRRQPRPAAPGAAGDRPVGEAFRLTDGEHRYLLTCPRGQRPLHRRRRPLPPARAPQARRACAGPPATRPSSPRPHA